MTVHLCVLASGSSGNCTLIRSGDAAVLIDAGLSARELLRRLEAVGCPPDALQGVCISHEHSDHTCGLGQLHLRHALPVYTNRGTSEGIRRQTALADLPCHIFATGQAFAIGPFQITPFAVPHDAYEPVGFLVEVEGVRLGVVTDMGMATTLIRANLKTCRAVVVESNHDEKMLRDAKRPEYLKQRILGRQGHLSNRAAAALLAEIAGPHLDAAFLAHLSEDCNQGEIALREARRGLTGAGHSHVRLFLTYPDRISEVWSS
ncbi:MAG TPA: MBL fold metallo-hydrolase [Kiritimatiellia bacterium]|nr:MBL fold metallo-hydrolase [Kiritimatiellia bacterium]HMP00334.1 MBL fold metallo-hydrolase [Kiritimatiellia bacterium]